MSIVMILDGSCILQSSHVPQNRPPSRERARGLELLRLLSARVVMVHDDDNTSSFKVIIRVKRGLSKR